MWDDYYIFLIALHVFTRLLLDEIYHLVDRITIWLIDDVILICVCLLDDLMIATVIWRGKPVDLNSHRLHAFFFHKQRFFSTQPQCCLTFSWIEFQMLLNTYGHHHTETLFMFTIFLLMSRSRLFMSYLCDLFLIFIFIFIMINRMNRDILVLLLIFWNMSYYFWMITWMKNVNNFQIAKVQPYGAV